MEDDTILTQDRMRVQMDAAVSKSRKVNGKYTSLAELGFDYVSMDDGWQRCNCSTRQDVDPSLPQCPNLCFGGQCTFHGQDGLPLVRKDRFPDMKTLVEYGHSLGLKVGTYLNNCICMEVNLQPHYEEDVRWFTDMGFDGVKIDGCGSSHNVSNYADLFNATGRPVRIENCHNSWPDFSTGSCPMNFFRTGGDIGPSMDSILTEAYSTIDAADLLVPRSGPGCWAYPDMSEVGNFPPGPTQHDEERSHWGLWCVISSPLILGFDMNDTEKMDRVWPLVTNADALAVSAAWAGHPGTLARVYPAVDAGYQAVLGPCDGSPATLGWRIVNGTLEAPRPPGSPAAQCVQAPPAQAACAPPTTFSGDAPCGLLLENCPGDPAPQASWSYVNRTVQWQDGNPKDSPVCLAGFPKNFDVTQGFFTRSAATVKMQGCSQLFSAPGGTTGTSCAAPRRGVDVADFRQVVGAQNASELCGRDLDACCEACDRNPGCKAFVWKEHEVHAKGCPSGDAFCWLLSNFSGIHRAKDGVFGAKQDPSTAPTVTFEWTPRGELRGSDGTCMTAAPVGGVQLWAKPLSSSRVAIFLLNPVAAPQALDWPLTDVPRFPGLALDCAATGCSVRDVWAQQDLSVPADTIRVSLAPWESAFYVVSAVEAASDPASPPEPADAVGGEALASIAV